MCFGYNPEGPLTIVGNLFDTLQMFLSWSEAMHVIWI